MSNDSIIQPFQAPNPKINQQPVYLITLSSKEYFLAVKSEEGPSSVRATGVFALPDAKAVARGKVISGYKDVLSGAKQEDFVDISFPWHRIDSIQSLMYRHKAVSK